MPLSNEIVRTNVDPRADAAQDHGVAGSFLGKYYTRIIIGKYERPKPFASPEFKQTMAVFLPIPNELRDDTTVSYTNINLETVGDVINGALGAGAGSALLRKSGDLAAAVGGGAAAIATAAASALPGAFGKIAGGATETITGAIGSLFPAEQITSALQQSRGVAPNPNPSVAFQGPVLRDFSYTWAFYPKSADESRAIDLLIKKLKSAALPSNYIKNTAAILNYPQMCQLNFYPWDKGGTGSWYWSDNSIIRYKKCVMQGVNANYNPFGTPGFFEGTELPISYQLTISFREIEYMLSEDWEDVKLTPGERGFDLGEGLGGLITGATDLSGQVKTGTEQITSDLGKALAQEATQ